MAGPPNIERAKTNQTELDRYLEAYPLEWFDPTVREAFNLIFREYAAVAEGILSIPENKLYVSAIPETDSYAQEVWHMARNNVMRGLSLQGKSPFTLPDEWKSPTVPLTDPPTGQELANLLFKTTGELYSPLLHNHLKNGGEGLNTTVMWFTGPNETGQVPIVSVLLQAAVHAGRHGGIGIIETIAAGKHRPQQDKVNWGG